MQKPKQKDERKRLEVRPVLSPKGSPSMDRELKQHLHMAIANNHDWLKDEVKKDVWYHNRRIGDFVEERQHIFYRSKTIFLCIEFNRIDLVFGNTLLINGHEIEAGFFEKMFLRRKLEAAWRRSKAKLVTNHLNDVSKDRLNKVLDEMSAMTKKGN